MEGFPVIYSQRLVLRAFSEADIPALFDIFSRDEVTQYYDCYSYVSEEQASRDVKRWMSSYADKEAKGYRWAISLLDSPNKLIGSCGLHGVSFHNKSFEIGYDLHPDNWGKGLATEAVSALIEFCFSQNFPFLVNRITAVTDVVSPKSISVLDKLGFQMEGILRQNEYFKDRFNDSRIFSMLRNDWVKIKSEY